MTRAQRSAWDAALAFIHRLRDAGHTALLAGGCVRDMLLTRTPKDYDVATDAVPDRVLELFPRARKVGAQFGVILARKFGHDVEIATFRSDGVYSDGRRPDSVTFGDAEQDALRRDFTINGLFYDPIEERVVDYIEGQKDLAARIIRTIGDPALRFGEDHLRMLRAIRFAATLGFTVEPGTLDAIRTHAPKLTAISAERVWMELEKMLASPGRTTAWTLLMETGLRDFIASGWRPDASQSATALRRLVALPNEPLEACLALAAIMLDEGERTARNFSRSLKMSNRETHLLTWLVRSVPFMRTHPDMELADLKILMAHEHWVCALDLLRAELMATSSGTEPHETLVNRVSSIPADAIAPAPLLTGEDLMPLGVPPGPKLGQVLKVTYRAQLNEEIRTKQEAHQLARDLMDQV